METFVWTAIQIADGSYLPSLPRKGMETLSLQSIPPFAVGYLPSLPRKGMETQTNLPNYSTRNCGVTYHHFPARGWKLSLSKILLFYKGYLPSLPRKGMETVRPSYEVGKVKFVTYHHFPARGWKPQVL